MAEHDAYWFFSQLDPGIRHHTTDRATLDRAQVLADLDLVTIETGPYVSLTTLGQAIQLIGHFDGWPDYTKAPKMTFAYINHEGVPRTPVVTPVRHNALWLGVSIYHEGEQWFLKAFDHERKALRDFAMTDASFNGMPLIATSYPLPTHKGAVAPEGEPAKLEEKARAPYANPALAMPYGNNVDPLLKIKPVVIEYTDLDPGVLTTATTWEDLDLDSLERVEVIIALEEALDLKFSDDDIDHLENLGQLAALVDIKLETKTHG